MWLQSKATFVCKTKSGSFWFIFFPPFPQQALKSATAFLHGNRRSTVCWPVSFTAVQTGCSQRILLYFFNKWSILVGSESSCFMLACLFGRLKYNTRLPDSFYILKKHDSTQSERQANMKRPVQSGGSSALQFGMKRGKLKHLREIIIPSNKPSSSHIESAASITPATLMLQITRLRVSPSQRIKGFQVVFKQLLPFLLKLILGIPAQARTAVLLCSHHAFRQTDSLPLQPAWQEGKAALWPTTHP